MEAQSHIEPFLEVRVKDLSKQPGLVAACAGYELGKWRCSGLAKHIVKWLPEFALRRNEREGMNSSNAVDMLAKATRLIYTSNKYSGIRSTRG
jgi:hypothetical protein